MRASTLVCVLGLSLATVRVGRAQSVDPAAVAVDTSEQLARDHFKQAEIDFNLGKFEDALHGYQAAYEAKPLTAFLFNIAQCYRNLGDYERARFFYKRYLTLEPRTPNRRVVNDLIAEVTRLQKAAPVPAESRPEGTPAPPAGSSSFVPIADPPAAPPRPAPRPAAALALNAPAPAATRTREPELVARLPPPTEPRRPVYKRWWFWGGLAAVVAGGVVAAVLLTRPQADHGTQPPIDAR
ncbi:MAG TPA: tetratricopeptide repeat protein [Polyangia bacterium]|nr:tetratricopeptide repeat protein [Polyangia bacterium]